MYVVCGVRNTEEFTPLFSSHTKEISHFEQKYTLSCEKRGSGFIKKILRKKHLQLSFISTHWTTELFLLFYWYFSVVFANNIFIAVVFLSDSGSYSVTQA